MSGDFMDYVRQGAAQFAEKLPAHPTSMEHGRVFATQLVDAVRTGAESPDALLAAFHLASQAGPQADSIVRGFAAELQELIRESRT